MEAGIETGRVDRHRSDRPPSRVTGRVEIIRPAYDVAFLFPTLQAFQSSNTTEKVRLNGENTLTSNGCNLIG